MKKPFIYLLTAGLAVSMISNTGTANAAQSDATVTFTVPETPVVVEPLQPTDPTQPLNPEPDEGVIPENRGMLAFDYISNFDFGNVPIDLANTDDQEIKVETVNPSVQVTDQRQTGQGWRVTGELSSFSSGNDTTLNSASITLNSGGALSPLANLNGPKVESDIELVSNGGAKDIATADAITDTGNLSTAEGLGTWVISWLESNQVEGKDNVVLTVPARTATAGDHSAVITWTLYDGPGTDSAIVNTDNTTEEL